MTRVTLFGASLSTPLFGAGLPTPLFGAGLPTPLFGAGLPTPPSDLTEGLPIQTPFKADRINLNEGLADDNPLFQDQIRIDRRFSRGHDRVGRLGEIIKPKSFDRSQFNLPTFVMHQDSAIF